MPWIDEKELVRMIKKGLLMIQGRKLASPFLFSNLGAAPMETIKIEEIVFREDLYPRFEPNQQIIQRYSNSIEYLPPIKINQNKILIDGFHRWKAHQLAKQETIKADIVQTESEKQLKKFAYQLNSIHGLQITNDEKRKYAVEMIEEMTIEELSQILSTSINTIRDWTKNRREEIEKEKRRLIIENHLRAWNTQEQIAEIIRNEKIIWSDITRQTISNIIKDFANDSEFAKICKDWNLDSTDKDYNKAKPFRYNIWNIEKKQKETNHFGHFPQILMDNLLWYHTKPLDIIYDPFAGDGTTVDSCKAMYRRYYCSDRIVKPGREKDIKQWDITKGIPNDLPRPDLLFLDPPYWLLAKKEYSEDNTDLANMTYEQFNQVLFDFVRLLINKKIKRIAYLIRPIWDINENEWIWCDPLFDFYEIINKKYKMESRCVLPYSTEQYTGLWVDRAKKANKYLILNRELTIFKLK
ncbi:MAG: DNA methyltransferase [Candidatus Hodarchaeota archaeon]